MASTQLQLCSEPKTAITSNQEKDTTPTTVRYIAKL
jgi:hypothetical protein